MRLKITFMALLLMTFPYVVNAQLSPGPLAESHAHLSGLTNCLTCHTWGSQDLTPKCVDCHSPIQLRVREGLGFHGRITEEACQDCHSDHKGRDFEMIHWEPSRDEFDHTQTGFEIEGKHVELKCQDCHRANLIVSEDVLSYAQKQSSGEVLSKTFLGLGTSCVACHTDVHSGEFEARSCQDCHTMDSWKTAREDYDHDIDTEFALRGAHKRLDCEKCHKSSQPAFGEIVVPRFSGLKFDLCTDCHADEHKGSFGTNCLKCHTENTFKQIGLTGAFDHQKTRYPLVGRHVAVACEKCHTQEGMFKSDDSFDQCEDCHTDHHKGVFKRNNPEVSCEKCHNVRGFSPPLFGIAEHRTTRFELDGAHLAQPCFFCHISDNQPRYRWDPLNCNACHDTAHGQQFMRYQESGNWCENCHLSSDWTDLSFDHGTTNFPLTGKHAEITCRSCHMATLDEVRYENTTSSCASCHDDVHGGQFVVKGCEGCHSSETWKIHIFDHASHTVFPLDGKHENLACGQCHKFEEAIKTIRFKPIPHKCQDCHSFGGYDQ